MKNKVAVLLRLGAMASRFLALLILAAFLEPLEVGLYGLVLAAIAYVSYALGLDFYTFSTRELIRADRGERRWILTGHATLLTLTYAVVLPATLLLFVAGLLPWWVAPWFLLLLPLEHLGLELDRVLVAAGDPFGASATVFVRQGVWPVAVTLLFALAPGTRTLGYVFVVWALCAGAALGIGLVLALRVTRGGVRRPVDWTWIRRGVRVAALLLLGTLMLRVVLTADRYVVAALSEPETLASYTLLIGLANGLTLGIAAAVHQFQYPRMVAAAHEGDEERLRQATRTMGLHTLVLCAVFVLALLVLARPLVDAVGGPAYVEELWMLPWLLLATVLFNLSMVPHFVLYARDRDRFLTGSAGVSLAVFVVTIGVMVASGAAEATPVLTALVTANATLLGLKAAGAWTQGTRPVGGQGG